jgi:hypothetical protein
LTRLNRVSAKAAFVPGDVQPVVIIDELSGMSANSVRMGKSDDNPEAGRTGDDYKGMEKSWIGGSRQSLCKW